MPTTLETNGLSSVLVNGDCVEVMKSLPDASMDAIVCDPPYGLEFMGKEFDKLGSGESQERWHTAWCTEAFRVLKPGGHLLAFGGTRTFHRLACAVEDAGFEIRDSVIWCYGSGFPKSLDVSKALDKSAGAVREVIEQRRVKGGGMEHVNRTNAETHDYRPDGYQKGENILDITAPATEAAKTWEGWGTALKPAFEPVVVGRKPLAGTVAENVLKHGTGALNIAATRIPFASAADEKESKDKNQHEDFGTEPLTGNVTYGDYSMVQPKNYNPPGRWPSNLLLAHSPSCVHLDTEGDTDLWACVPGCPIRALDAQSGVGKTGEGASRYFMRFDPLDAPFIYRAKANKKERDAGCENLPTQQQDLTREPGLPGSDNPRNRGAKQRFNAHPTVKPVAVMAYLTKLVTAPGGWILDPFMGSGTTGIAAFQEGFNFIGIEKEADYMAIAEARISHAHTKGN
jgi:site-specific DNA-methyltransferase (adenine-specific)